MNDLRSALLVASLLVLSSCAGTGPQGVAPGSPTPAAATAASEVVEPAAVPVTTHLVATTAPPVIENVPTPLYPPTPLPAASPEVPAMAVVSDFYDALNRGERPNVALPSGPETERLLLVAGYLGANFRHHCTENDPVGGVVSIECEEAIMDDFYGPARILLDGTTAFSVYGDRLEVDRGYACRPPAGDAWRYLQEFDDWLQKTGNATILRRAHGGDPELPCTPYPFSAADAESYAQLAAEFRSSSDEYPIGVAEALAAVEDYYAEIAAGNWDRMRSLYSTTDPRNMESAIAMGATFEHECDVLRPDAQWLQVVRIRCIETMHDDFYGPGGLALSGVVVYRHTGTLRLESGGGCPWGTEPPALFLEYIDDFQVWLRSEGRWISDMLGIHGGNPLYMPCGPYPFATVPSTEAVASAREELATFVAQSPEWPRSD